MTDDYSDMENLEIYGLALGLNIHPSHRAYLMGALSRPPSSDVHRHAASLVCALSTGTRPSPPIPPTSRAYEVYSVIIARDLTRLLQIVRLNPGKPVASMALNEISWRYRNSVPCVLPPELAGRVDAPSDTE